MSVERRAFLKTGALFALIAACNPGALFGPRGCESADTDPLPSVDPPQLRDVYVVDDFSGTQLGTQDNPYSPRTAAEFDALMTTLAADDYLAHHWSGRFWTKGSYRWGALSSANWRAGKYWSIDGTAEVAIDPNAIPDSEVDGQPLFVLASQSGRPQTRGLTLIGNHSALADRWRARGASLRTGGILFYGRGLIDGVTFRNFGAIGAETFVAEIVGSGSITNSRFLDYDPASSDDQVTVLRITGSENGESMTGEPCLMEGNETVATGDNQVQAHTMYCVERGVVRRNTTRGVRVAYYGDYFRTRGVKILDNDFEAIDHGVQLLLSPAGEFSHEAYEIGAQRMVTGGANVSLIATATSATRFIRNVEVDPTLTLENFGATDVTRGGCRLAA